MSQARDARSRILGAAAEAFVAGEGVIEMADVARRAGASVGLAYHYFGSKAGLLSAVIADFYDRYDAVTNQRYDKQLGWPERESRRLRDAIAFLYHDPVAPIVLGRLSGSAEVMTAETARRETLIELAARNIADGQKRGAIPRDIDSAIASAMIIGGIRQALGRALSTPSRPGQDRLARQIWSLIASGLSLSAAKPGRRCRTVK